MAIYQFFGYILHQKLAFTVLGKFSGTIDFCQTFKGNSMRGIDCAHFRTLKTLPWPWFREGISVLKRKSNIFGFLWENRQFLGFSRRRIDCAHSRSMKMLPWPWFREGIGVLKRKSIYLRINLYYNYTTGCFKKKPYFSKIRLYDKIFGFLGVKSCEKSIARIAENWKCFLDPDSGKWVCFIEAKIWKFWIFLLKSSF